MAAKKGHEKIGGRGAGTPNKKTAQWLVFEDYMLNAGLEKFQAEVNKLQGKDFIIAMTNMMDFFKPKMNRTTHDGEISTKIVVKRPEKDNL